MKRILLLLAGMALLCACHKENSITPVKKTTWLTGKWSRTKRVFTYVKYQVAQKDSSYEANELNFIDDKTVTQSTSGDKIYFYSLTGPYGPYIDFNGSANWIIGKINDNTITLSGQIYITTPYNYTDTYVREVAK